MFRIKHRKIKTIVLPCLGKCISLIGIIQILAGQPAANTINSVVSGTITINEDDFSILPIYHTKIDSINWAICDSAKYGNLVYTDSSIIYTPKHDYYGIDKLILSKSDSVNIDSIIFYINILPVNDAPEFTEHIGLLEYDEDGGLDIPIDYWSSKVTDPDNAKAEFQFTISSEEFIRVEKNERHFMFSSEKNWFGTEMLTLKVSDGTLFDSTRISITVNPVNDAPVFTSKIEDITFEEDYSYSLSVDMWHKNIFDVDNNVEDLDIFVQGGDSITFERDDSLLSFYSPHNWYGNEILSAIISDGELFDTTTFNVNVIPVNDSPILLIDSLYLSFYEDDTLNYSTKEWHEVIFDPETSPESLSISVFSGKYVTALLAKTKTIAEFYSVVNWFGIDTLNVVISDGILSDTCELYIEVIPVNDPPKFISEIPLITAKEDMQLSADIRDWHSHVSDADNLIDELSWDVVSGHSINAVIENQFIRFSAPDNWFGTDSLLIIASDGEYFDAVTLTINVKSVNDPPEFVETLMPIELEEDNPLSLPYHTLFTFVNDVDHSDEELLWNFSNGAIITTATTDSTAEFYPTLDRNGIDSIYVVVSDGELSDTFTVIVTILPVNDAPEFTEHIGLLEYDEDGGLDIPIDYWSSKVTDPDNAKAEFQFTISSEEFIRVEKNERHFMFSSEKNWFGTEMLTLKVSDGTLFDSTRISITVNPVNDAPVFTSKIEDITFEEDYSYSLSVDMWHKNIFDVDNNVEDLDIFVQGGDSITFERDDSLLSFYSPHNWYGNEILSAIISDGELFDTTTFNVNVIPVNDPPVFIQDIEKIAIKEDEKYINVIENWFVHVADPDDAINVLSWQFESPENIVVNISSGIIEISPKENWFGDKSIKLLVSDGEFTDSTIVNIHIAAVNDPPVLDKLLNQLVLKEDKRYTKPISDYFHFVTDVDNNDKELVWSFESGNNIRVEKGDSTLIIYPSQDWNGIDTIAVQVTDNEYIDLSSIEVIVEPVNDPPIFTNSLPECKFSEDGQLDILLDDWFNVIEDVDNTNEEIDFCVLDGKTTLIVPSEKGFLFKSHPDWNGHDTVEVIICDGEYSDTNFVFISVSPVNDAPVFEKSLPKIRYDEDHEKLIMFSEWFTNITDVDNNDDELTWEIRNGRVIEVASSTYSGILISPQHWFGYDTLTVIVNDGEYQDTTTVSVEIFPVNDPPNLAAIIPDTAFYEDGYLSIPDNRWKPYVSDPDHDFNNLNWRIMGTQVLSASGGENSIDFHAPGDWFGVDRVILIASDGLLADTSYFRIRVMPVNDPPKLAPIPKIEFDEDTEFILELDNFVNDNDDEKTTLIWSAYLNEATVETKVISDRWFYYPGRLRSSKPSAEKEVENQNGNQVQIYIDNTSRKAVIIPTLNYYGENIQYILKVKDPRDASDIETLNISVLPVNDPPVLEQVPEITFNEDETFSDSLYLWFPHVYDADHKDSQLNWHVKSGEKVKSKLKDGFVFLDGHNNWFGKDTLTLFVDDGEYHDTTDLAVNILPINDPPESFELIGHIIGDSVNITFQWYPSADIDGDTLVYALHLKSENLDTVVANIRGKHSLLFKGRDILETGVLYEWYIEASDGKDITWCSNPLNFYLQHVPGNYFLSQNYPNPFNKVTTIPFDVAEMGRIKIMVYDMHGKEIVRLIDEFLRPGRHEVKWDGKDWHSRDVATGVYLITMMADDFSQVKKMMLIK